MFSTLETCQHSEAVRLHMERLALHIPLACALVGDLVVVGAVLVLLRGLV